MKRWISFILLLFPFLASAETLKSSPLTERLSISPDPIKADLQWQTLQSIVTVFGKGFSLQTHPTHIPIDWSQEKNLRGLMRSGLIKLTITQPFK